MTDTPQERRAAATGEIDYLLTRIRERVQAGPTVRAPTTRFTAEKFEAVRDALEEALQRAIELSDHL